MEQIREAIAQLVRGLTSYTVRNSLTNEVVVAFPAEPELAAAETCGARPLPFKLRLRGRKMILMSE